jgi:hypothetical protein
MAGKDASEVKLDAYKLEPRPQDNRPELMKFWHEIQPVEGNKNHLFKFKGQIDERLPSQSILEAKFQSGTWGETVMITAPILIFNPPKIVTIPMNVRSFDKNHIGKPVAAVEQARRLQFFRKSYFIHEKQEAMALVMLASAYRLAATHYQGEFDEINIQDTTSLNNYISTTEYNKESQKLVNLAAIKLEAQVENAKELKNEIADEIYVNPKLADLLIEHAPHELVKDEVNHELAERLKKLSNTNKPLIDTTFMDMKDYNKAFESYISGNFPCTDGANIVTQNTAKLDRIR